MERQAADERVSEGLGELRILVVARPKLCDGGGVAVSDLPDELKNIGGGDFRIAPSEPSMHLIDALCAGSAKPQF